MRAGHRLVRPRPWSIHALNSYWLFFSCKWTLSFRVTASPFGSLKSHLQISHTLFFIFSHFLDHVYSPQWKTACCILMLRTLLSFNFSQMFPFKWIIYTNLKIILILFTYPHVLPIFSVKLLTNKVFFTSRLSKSLHKDMNNDLKNVYWGIHVSLKKASSRYVCFASAVLHHEKLEEKGLWIFLVLLNASTHKVNDFTFLTKNAALKLCHFSK